MNFLKTIMMVTVLSSTAFAGDHTINIVGRAGWNYKDNDVQKSGTPNSSSFNMDFLRTTFAGTLTPTVKYFATTDLLANSSTNDSVDGTSGFIDEAYITKTFSFGTSLILGKKAVLVGGREYDYLNFDRYTSSAFFSNTPFNQVGATLSHEVAGQTFMAQYFNGNKNNGNTPETNAQSKFGYAVGWYGNLHNSMIKPIIAYTVVPEAAGASSTNDHRANKGDDTYLGSGIQFNLPMDLIVETDYNIFTEKDAAGTVAAKKDIKTTSIVGLVKYAGEKCAPFVKVVSDEVKLQTVKTSTKFGYDLGVEFKEAKDDMIRYHIVYSGSTVKSNLDTSEVKTAPSSILVGLKFDAAILK